MKCEMWNNLHCIQIMEHTFSFKVKTSIFKIETTWLMYILHATKWLIIWEVINIPFMEELLGFTTCLPTTLEE